MNDTELACLQEKIGINSEQFDTLTNEQQAIIYEKISRRELTKDDISALIGVVPTFVNGFLDTVKTMTKVASDVSESHKNAFDTLRSLDSFVEPLNTLAKGCESKEERIAIAENIQKIVFKICDTTAELQKENNRATQDYLAKLGDLVPIILITALLAGCGGYALATSSKKTNATPQN